MSLQSWKKKYYPKKPSKRMAKVQAIEHSLTKWIGLRDKNLKRHGVKKTCRSIQDGGYCGMPINGESCALCVKYYNYEHIVVDNPCKKCPLYIAGDYCDKNNSSYRTWVRAGNPEPMIKALREILKIAKGEKK